MTAEEWSGVAKVAGVKAPSSATVLRVLEILRERAA